MRWIGRTACLLGLALLGPGIDASRSDDRPKPGPEAVDRVLAEWHGKVSSTRSVDVRFRRIDHAKGQGSRSYEGRAIMASPNLAMMEVSPIEADGKVGSLQERMIWNGRSILQFDMAEHQAHRFPLLDEWPAPPTLMRLPFFFGMSVEEAKRDFDWAILRDEPEDLVLKITPRRMPRASSSFERCVLVLDRTTFSPRHMIVSGGGEEGSREFDALDIRRNVDVDVEGMKAPCLDAWSVTEHNGKLLRWFFR